MTGKKTGRKISEKTFEAAMTQLEQVVAELENPDVPLEDSLQLFEQGMKLSHLLEKRLDEAEKKIEVLVKANDGSLEATPYDEPKEPAKPNDTEDDDVPF